MNKIFKTNNSSKFIYLHKILFQTIILTLVVVLIVKYYKGISDLGFLVYTLGVFLPWFIIFGFPLLLLYFNHIKHSREVVFECSYDSFNYSNGSKSIKFKKNDILKIELWLTPPAYDKRIDWQYFGKYHFTKIYTKQNYIINLSCLVFDETEDIFDENLIKRKKKFFPLMKESIIG